MVRGRLRLYLGLGLGGGVSIYNPQTDSCQGIKARGTCSSAIGTRALAGGSLRTGGGACLSDAAIGSVPDQFSSHAMLSGGSYAPRRAARS